MAALRIFEYGRVAPVRGDHRRRHLNRFARLVNLGGRISQGRARRQVERDGHRLQLADVVDRSRAGTALHRGKAADRHQHSATGAHINAVQRKLVLLGFRREFHDHLVGVGGQVNGGHLAFAKRAVQGVANRLHAHAQRVGAIAVDLQLRLQTAHLRIAGHVPENRVRPHFFLQFGRPAAELVGAQALQDVLVLGFALASAELQVLHRAHEHIQAHYRTQLAPQTFNHLFGWYPLVGRLERDEHAANALAVAAAVEGVHRSHVLVIADDGCGALLQLHHRRERDVLPALGGDNDLADILFREKPFGNHVHHVHRAAQGGQRNQQDQFAPAQGQIQHPHVPA